ncbi:MAG: glycosidase, partial [Flammeovirgaceae bacterium]
RGLYTSYPRAAYYALKEVHSINPYQEDVTLMSLQNHFNRIQLVDAIIKARGDKAALAGEQTSKIRLSELRADLSTFFTGGSLITTPTKADPTKAVYPNKLGFDRMESYFVGIEANPASNMRANVSFNVLGHVAENPINEIFYENRGRQQSIITQNGTTVSTSFDRVQVYRADYSWNHKN